MNKEQLAKFILAKRNPRSLVASRTIFNNGASLSIQASENHYCEPRKSDGVVWDSYEVAFGDGGVNLDPLKEIIEAAEEYGDTVLGFVPTDLILQVIALNGGVAK